MLIFNEVRRVRTTGLPQALTLCVRGHTAADRRRTDPASNSGGRRSLGVKPVSSYKGGGDLYTGRSAECLWYGPAQAMPT